MFPRNSLVNKRNLLYLNTMPFEMIVSQGRLWEIANRNLGGYCRRACSIFFQSKETKVVEIKPGENICYCIEMASEKIKLSFLRYVYRIFSLIRLILYLKKICRKNSIDVIVSQSNALRDLEVASLIISKFYKIPFLAYIGRNSTALKLNKGISEELLYQVEAAILRYADSVILRPGTEKILSKYYKIKPSKIVTIPHITEFHKFTGLSEIPGNLKEWMRGKKVILYYGRLEKDKLVEDIIRSFALVKANFNDLLLLLVGSGQQKNKLGMLVNKLDLKNYVRIEPSMSQEKLAPISVTAEIHVHPTGGKGLLESAVLGRPVITYDAYSYNYGLVEHMKTGLKAQFRNINSVADCITKYLANQDLGKRLGEALKKKALEQHDSARGEKIFCAAINSFL